MREFIEARPYLPQKPPGSVESEGVAGPIEEEMSVIGDIAIAIS